MLRRTFPASSQNCLFYHCGHKGSLVVHILAFNCPNAMRGSLVASHISFYHCGHKGSLVVRILAFNCPNAMRGSHIASPKTKALPYFRGLMIRSLSHLRYGRKPDEQEVKPLVFLVLWEKGKSCHQLSFGHCLNSAFHSCCLTLPPVTRSVQRSPELFNYIRCSFAKVMSLQTSVCFVSS